MLADHVGCAGAIGATCSPVGEGFLISKAKLHMACRNRWEEFAVRGEGVAGFISPQLARDVTTALVEIRAPGELTAFRRPRGSPTWQLP